MSSQAPASERRRQRQATWKSLESCFHAAVCDWCRSSFDSPTRVQSEAWPAIARGENTLLLAPTGSGKTLAAFLVAIHRIMFGQARVGGATPATQVADRSTARDTASHAAGGGAPTIERPAGVRVLYISPLKALGVDVERNLRAPIAGIRAAAERAGYAYHDPRVGVRSGDTPARDRQQMLREPPDILITTPESLFLLLTSRGRATLQHVETVIIDEIHSMVATKRGAHLFLSLERLERLRREAGELEPLKRIGLSATQRPLHEVARLLGGADWEAPESVEVQTPSIDVTRSESTSEEDSPTETSAFVSFASQRALVPRPVTLVQAGQGKQLDLRIEVPVEDMARLAASAGPGEGRAVDGPTDAVATVPSIWPAIHARLVELIQQHRSTMIFVNSRRLAERLATAINEAAEAEVALAHHGSIARATRLQIEDRLKQGLLPAIVATSSLELGIDMGSVDLVVQLESPPTIASGIQRIGRSGHHVGGQSRGILFPKYRGDLLACSAAAARMMRGEVEETFYPRNPLDVLAQQIVAIVAEGPCAVESLFDLVRQAAPFHDLPRSSFESILDLLTGRYPSEAFSELRPRLNWDRVAGLLTPRRGAQRLAIMNAGTIPDRGLYGVFLVGDEGGQSRVGELDEEMVFEIHAGDVFLLGASSWRVVEITNDRVLVAPAPGEPGRMPFWRGDGPGRPLEFGRAIGQLTRQLLSRSDQAATQQLVDEHGLEPQAARNLMQYLRDQVEATGEAPSDQVVVVESFLDEVGDWRVTILTPFGSRVHAPWATAVIARLRETSGDEIDMMWSDDGIVFRIPEADGVPELSQFFPAADEIESLVVRQLGSTALFAGRFRENAARALLLPRRSPNRRSPLWMQRRRAADLLSVAAGFPSFPLLMETYRECLRDIFDLPGLKQLLQDIESQQVRIHPVETPQASPFASSLLFNYTANFIYNGDTPLAERRAQALSLDHAQLAELLGSAEMRELLSPEAVDEIALELQRLDHRYPVLDLDQLHDLLRQLGDLHTSELEQRVDEAHRPQVAGWLEQLVTQRRVVSVPIGQEERWIAVEDAARYRDALGVPLPLGLPQAFLESAADPLLELLSRYARTHAPFTAEQPAERFALGAGTVRMGLEQLTQRGRLLEGEFLPGRRGREYTDPQVLRWIKRRSLAQWRKELEPVDQTALARFLPAWQAVTQPRRGLDGLLDALQQLQGVALPCSTWEDEVLPRRVRDFHVSQLDELCAAGEVIWRGVESLGNDDGRIAFFLHDHFAALSTDADPVEDEVAERIRQLLHQRGALFFDQIVREVGGFPPDVLQSLWHLVWTGHVTNDTLAPLRARRKPARGTPGRSRAAGGRGARGRLAGGRFRSRRAAVAPGSEGRWTLLQNSFTPLADPTARQLAFATQLVDRYGVLTRELAMSENPRGGFSGIYPVLKAMEEAGRVRRGYFIAGLGASQFAAPGAEDRLRQMNARTPESEREVCVLAAADPANPYGSAFDWPATPVEGARPQRAAGARVVLIGGRLVGYLNRTGQHLFYWLPEMEVEAAEPTRLLAQALATEAARGPLLLEKINGQNALQSPLRAALQAQGFIALSRGLLHK